MTPFTVSLVFGGEADNIAQLMIIDAPYEGRNQYATCHMGQAKVIPSPELLGKYIATRDDFIRGGSNPVELMIYYVQTALLQGAA